ncbi:hypothetical protein J6590_043627 [Homalodisca vitripennis]|nr:hypothetical protein J6590_043627 [Homalodisca vitripennis]
MSKYKLNDNWDKIVWVTIKFQTKSTLWSHKRDVSNGRDNCKPQKDARPRDSWIYYWRPVVNKHRVSYLPPRVEPLQVTVQEHLAVESAEPVQESFLRPRE